MVKHNFLVKNCVDDLPRMARKAFHIATTGRPGPVLIDVPKDISHAAFTATYVYPETVTLRSYNPAVRATAGRSDKAVDAHAATPSGR